MDNTSPNNTCITGDLLDRTIDCMQILTAIGNIRARNEPVTKETLMEELKRVQYGDGPTEKAKLLCRVWAEHGTGPQ